MSRENIASHLPAMAQKQPDTYAVVVYNKTKSVSARYKNAYSYKQLNEVSDLVANGLKTYGIGKGTRTVLMLKPGLDFFALAFALLKLEAVLIAIDPGIGLRNLGRCLGEVAPEAFIGVSKAHIARLVFGWSKNTITKPILVGKDRLLNRFIIDLEQIKSLAKEKKFTISATRAEEMAAILFTSGSTGVPKGVVYTHANFNAQIKILNQLYAIHPSEIDLATFLLFSLFAPALGMTLIVPDMDFTRPGSVNPQKIIDALIQYKCTTMFGSPALLNRVSQWGENKKIKLPALKRILSAGAPVAPMVLKRMKSLLYDDGKIFTPYGATEALPISSIGSDEILKETAALTAVGKGVCVGRQVTGLVVRIIKLSDEVISEWDDALALPASEIGEICVRGAQVTHSYFNRHEATDLAKIKTKDAFYHRMGDVGYLDDQGRLWFCGRKTQRVITETETLFTICCEGIFNTHPFVFRTALVGATINNKIFPVICVELEPEYKWSNKAELTEALLMLGANNPVTKSIKRVLFHSAFPVDIRHNAKIGREKLAQWATAKLT